MGDVKTEECGLCGKTDLTIEDCGKCKVRICPECAKDPSAQSPICRRCHELKV